MKQLERLHKGTGNKATVIQHCHLVVKMTLQQLNVLYILRHMEDNAANNKANNPTLDNFLHLLVSASKHV